MSAASYYALTMIKSFKTEQIDRSGNEQIDVGSNEQQKLVSKSEPKKTDASSVKREKICRACTLPGKIPLIGNKEDLIAALRKLCNIAIDAKDKLPKYLCKSCFDALLASIKFRAMVRSSDKILQKEFNQATIRYINVRSNEFLGVPPASPKPQPSVKRVKREENQKNIRKIRKTAAAAAPAHNFFLNQDEETSNFDDETFEAQHNYRHCANCDLTFDSHKELMEHKRTQEHKTAKRQCTVCLKEVLAKNFKLHMRYHEQDYSHVCDICGESFITKPQFDLHKQSHGTIEFPFGCDFCPYRTHIKSVLKKHMRIHSSDMPYQCSECPKGFKFGSNLNRHMLSHKTRYSFNCSTCGKGFHKSQALDAHVRVDHEGVKEHVCNICGKEFGYRKQMMKHQLKVHKREKLKRGRMPLYLLQEKRQRESLEQQ